MTGLNVLGLLFLASLIVGPLSLIRYFNTHPLEGSQMPSPQKISEWIKKVVEKDAPRPKPKK